MKLYAVCALRKHGEDPFILECFRSSSGANQYAHDLAAADPTHELYCFIAVKPVKVI